MRASLAVKLTMLLALVLVAFINAQVRAQGDDIPETVLITGSLIEGVDPPGPFSELTNDELRALLPGTYINDLFPLFLNCDRSWRQSGEYNTYDTGRYSIRNNQVCIEGGAAFPFCAKFLRNDAGRLYIQKDGVRRPRMVEILPSHQACARR